MFFTFLTIPISLLINSYILFLFIYEVFRFGISQITEFDWISYGFLVFICFAIFFAAGDARRKMEKDFEKKQIDRLARYRISAAYGFLAISIFSILGKVAGIYMTDHPVDCVGGPFIIYSAFISNYMFFILETDWKCKITRISSPIAFCFWLVVIIAFHVITLIYTLVHSEKSQRGYPKINQTVLSVVFAFCNIDLLSISFGTMEMKKRFEEENVELAEVVASSERDGGAGNETTSGTTSINGPSSSSECKICMQVYSDQIIPRILVQCGHTVCQNCVENLMKAHNRQLVFCPFCQQATLVNGSPDKLPKNFALMETIV